MKKEKVISFAVWLVVLALWVGVYGQQGGGGFTFKPSNYVDVTLTNSQLDTVYVLFPTNTADWYISTTKPTVYYSGTKLRDPESRCSGDVDVFLETNTTSGSTDSLSHWVKPICWDVKDTELKVIKSDSTFIWFGSSGTYTNTSAEALDWTDTQEYHCTLTSALWPVVGFAIFARQTATTAVCTCTYEVSGSKQW